MGFYSNPFYVVIGVLGGEMKIIHGSTTCVANTPTATGIGAHYGLLLVSHAGLGTSALYFGWHSGCEAIKGGSGISVTKDGTDWYVTRENNDGALKWTFIHAGL